MPEHDIVRRAREFAARAHAQQTYGDKLYIYHLEQVEFTLARFGQNSPELQAAALLHDTLEDTPTNYNDLKVQFGYTVAELVYAVTDELGRNRAERHAKTYPKIAGVPDATTLKLADRIANVEHSIMTVDRNKLAMYQKEHLDFLVALCHAGCGPPAMWGYLEVMVQSGEKPALPSN